jgi:AbrB family looped-hinge helix DNA binding protein
MAVNRITIGEGGRVVIPAEYRKAMQLKTGDELVVRMKDGELHLFSQQQAFKRLQALAQKHRPKHIKSMTDDFLAYRKQDSGD